MAQRGKSRISLSNIIIILILVLTVIGLIVSVLGLSLIYKKPKKLV